MALMSDKEFKEHKKRSMVYDKRLKKAIHEGDFEEMVKCIMLLAVKHNDSHDWKASPRTFMELLQTLHKFRAEFGSTEGGFDEILKVMDGGKEE